MLGLGLAALPQKLLAEAAGFVIEVAIVASIGWHYGAAHIQAKWDAEKVAQLADYAAQVGRNNDLAAQLETERAKSHVVYQTITHEVDHVVDRPVYRNDCLDADGLRLVNAAFAGQAPASGIPAGAMPASAAAPGNHGG
jgi:hypothetical protein